MNILTWVLTWSFLKSKIKMFLFTRLVVLVVLLNTSSTHSSSTGGVVLMAVLC